jgi:hypothetical protein
MNKKQIVASLNKIANELDNSGLHTEANSVTNVMEKIAQMQMPQVAPISRPNQDTYGYQAAVDKWIATNQQAVNNALQSPMPMQALAPLLMNVQPVELANAIRVKIGQMKQGLA